MNQGRPTDDKLRSELESAARWGRYDDARVPAEARRLIGAGRLREAFGLLDASAVSPAQSNFAWRNMAAAASGLGLDERAAYYQARYNGATAERAAYTARLFEQIQAVVASDCDVQDGMSRVLDFCSAEVPHPQWDVFRDPRYLDYDYDLAYLTGRVERIFDDEPPDDEIDGLWFGLFNPYYEDQPTADMHIGGGVGAFEDPETWAEDLTWTPRAGRMTRSQVLHEIYRIAYWNSQDDGWTPGLGNDAEHPLCLTYAALVVRWLATTLPTDLLLGGASARVLQVGFDSGDFLEIGTLSRRGLAFPPDGMI